MKKMIFFDIDGTIVDEKTHEIPKSAIEAIKRARKNGHLVFINTGRTFFNVPKVIREIGFDGYICGCGTYINVDGQSLLDKSIPKEKCIQIIEKLREYKIDALLEGQNDFYFEQREPISSKTKQLKNKFEKRGYDVTKSWDDPNIVFDKLVIWTREESNLEAFKNYVISNFDYIDREDEEGEFGEIVLKGYSKATGIEFLRDYFNIDLKNCYAIGDSLNDLPMLQHVPNSIAMGNSCKGLFDLVDFVTKDIMEDGIEYALKHYNII
ncbi:Cof-type HAD-IIB family hydrolase [Clostridium felsineum]|uniref:Cof-type HAD-IIB family hydrolase n=1 Tax=Clostridium felsineum TaxID=36839 RepID=UPI00098C4C86|nr:Cof-type HAD-IIB family hydrolase [Clostridium felsineum]URZ15934.1 Putative bifunctional phosphatase/peptidyl-prolyl cis-trans isomerase [Clostridium felsineum DSM 794]